MVKTVLTQFQRTRPGRLAIGFLMLCLLFRAAIPAGFMPVLAGQGEAGGSLVQLCHGDAGSAQLLDMLESSHESTRPSSHSGVEHEQCAFSAFAMFSLSDVPAFGLDIFPAVSFETLPIRVFHSAFYSSHSARAPPSLQLYKN